MRETDYNGLVNSLDQVSSSTSGGPNLFVKTGFEYFIDSKQSFALSLHLFTKKHPNQSYSTVSHMNGMIRHLPINKDSADLLTPFLNY